MRRRRNAEAVPEPSRNAFSQARPGIRRRTPGPEHGRRAPGCSAFYPDRAGRPARNAGKTRYRTAFRPALAERLGTLGAQGLTGFPGSVLDRFVNNPFIFGKSRRYVKTQGALGFSGARQKRVTWRYRKNPAIPMVSGLVTPVTSFFLYNTRLKYTGLNFRGIGTCGTGCA